MEQVYTPELVALARAGGLQPQASPETGLLDRAAYYALGAVPQLIENVSMQANNLAGNSGGGRFLQEQDRLAPSSTTSGQVMDFVGHLAPVALEMGMLGGVTRAATGLTGITNGVATNTIADAVNFGALGAQENNTTGAEQAAEGGVMGLLSGLTRGKRLLPAAALALGSKLFFDNQDGGAPMMEGGNFSRGDLTGAANFISTMMGSKVGLTKPVKPQVVDNFGGQVEPQLGPDPLLALPGPTTVDSARHWNQLEWPHGEARNYSPTGEPIVTDLRASDTGVRALPAPEVAIGAKPWNELEWPHGEATTFSPSGEPLTVDLRGNERDPRFLPGPTTPPEGRFWNQIDEGAQRQPGDTGFVMPETPVKDFTMTQPVIEGEFRKIEDPLALPERSPDIIPELKGGEPVKPLTMVGDNMIPFDKFAQQLKDPVRERKFTGAPVAIKKSEWDKLPVVSDPAGAHGQIRDYNGVPHEWVASGKRVSARPVSEVIPPIDVSPTPTVAPENLQSLQNQKLKMKPKDEAGAVIPGLSNAIARGGLGFIAGGTAGASTDDPGDHSHFLVGGMVGAAAAMMGPSLARTITKGIAEAKLPKPDAPVSSPSVQGSSVGKATRSFDQVIEEMAGAPLHASATISERFVSAMDKAFNFTLPTVLHRGISEARGIASHLLDQVDNSLKKVSLRFQPDETMKAASNEFLDGVTTESEYLAKMKGQEDYAKYIMTARSSINGLQEMIKMGVKDPKKKALIEQTLGKYVTRSYRAFAGNWDPSVESVNSLVSHIIDKKIWPDASESQIRDHLYSYVREVNQTKGVYKASSSTQGQAIDQVAFKARKELSDEWRTFLGEVTNPTERINTTIYRLRPMAEAGKYMSDVVNKIKDVDGMPHYFASEAERVAYSTNVLQQLQRLDPASPEAQKLALQAAKLKNFVPVEKSPMYGLLQSGMVSRSAWNTLSTFDSMTGVMSHPILRAMGGLNALTKLSQTALSPVQFVRQIVSTPLMMAISRAEPMDVYEGMRILHDTNHVARKEMLEHGIMSADQMRQEITADFHTATGGKYDFGTLDASKLGMGKIDLDLYQRFASHGMSKWMNIYRTPDNAVRIGTYLSAKRRFAEILGKGLEDPEVIQKAVDHTNRYTVDYGMVAPAIKLARNVPGVNLYIGYISEIARISKNLMTDMINPATENGVGHSRAYAAIPLGLMSALPPIIQSVSEGELTPDDQKAWEKTKNLMPAYARDRFYFNIKRQKNGQFTYFDGTNIIPNDFINSMGKAIATGDMESLAAVQPVANIGNSPLLNIITSQISGKDVHTQRDFRPVGLGGVGDRLASVAKEIVPPITPGIGGEALRFEQAYTPNVEGSLGVTNPKTGRMITPSDFWLPYWSGLRSGSYNLTALEKQHVAEAKRNIAQEVSYMNSVVKAGADPTSKEYINAESRARQAIKEIQDTLTQQLGTQ